MLIRFLLALGLLAAPAFAADPPPRIRLVPFLTGLSQPLGYFDDGTGRCFVIEQAGVIRVVKNGRLAPTPLLNLKERVSSRGAECGLLGLAFHPGFRTNGRFFINYTSTISGHLETIISEFKMNTGSDTANPAGERILLRFDQPWENHNGGAIEFGPDGKLYIATGDGGAGGDPKNAGQRLDTLLGKILRIDVDGAEPYAVPPDNPFVGRANARGEIWAWGLRNPWRISFDRETKQLYAADVGQNKWEEIDIIEKGRNYGWSAREGAHDFKPERQAGELVDPIKEYGRDLGVSVTGGYVYRGREIPSLRGVYLYADYQSGRIWGLKWDGHSLTMDAELLKAPFLISSFGEDRNGELYLCDHRGGKIYRIAQ
jgi:glucose/arabinose dehydrogenase